LRTERIFMTVEAVPYETKECPFCAELIRDRAKKCPHCGEMLDVALRAIDDLRRSQQSQAGPTVFMNAGGGGGASANNQNIGDSGTQPAVTGVKSKTTAGILALLLGGIGAHKFYLGKGFQGLLYLIFFWTWIPMIIATIEGISYLMMSPQKFAAKYG